jgi:hypothetical protein
MQEKQRGSSGRGISAFHGLPPYALAALGSNGPVLAFVAPKDRKQTNSRWILNMPLLDHKSLI